MRYAEHNVTDDDVRAVEQVLRSRSLTQGPAAQRFEEALAEYVGARHAVAVSSGTAALHLAIAASSKYAATMLTSPLSFVATANAGEFSGCNVGFADVEEETGNLPAPSVDGVTYRTFGYQHDPAALRARGFDFPTPGAEPPDVYVPVHYAGRAAAIPRNVYSRRMVVVEDACHALGAFDFDGCSKVGSCAHSRATVFSFHPAKHITTGEGGAVTTNDDELARRLRMLRDHGRADGQMVALGYNYRMSDVAAALGWSQLRRLDSMVAQRRGIAGIYISRLQGIDDLTLPQPFGWAHAWHLFAVRVGRNRRDDVRVRLAAKGIHCQVHYDPIIPLQPWYAGRRNYRSGMFPNAEAWARDELSLPLYPTMRLEDLNAVVDAVREALP